MASSATGSSLLPLVAEKSYSTPEYVFRYPMDNALKKPSIPTCLKEIPEAVLRQIYAGCADSVDQKRICLTIFDVIAFAPKSACSYGSILRVLIPKHKITKEVFDIHLESMMSNGIIHCRLSSDAKDKEKQTKRDKNPALNATVLLLKAREMLLADRARLKRPLKAIFTDKKRKEAPKVFWNAVFRVAEKSSDRKRWVAPQFDPPDCREALASISLSKIHANDGSTDADDCYNVFNVAGLNAFRDDDGKLVKASGHVRKTYSAIHDQCETFGLASETIDRHLLKMLESGVLNTFIPKANRKLCFFATPFLIGAALKRDEKDPLKKTPVRTPEFVKQYLVPKHDSDVAICKQRDVVAKCKSVCEILHRESICRIHPHPESDEGKTALTIFDVITLAVEKGENDTRVLPKFFPPCDMQWGKILQLCATFGIDEPTVAKLTEEMMKRRVLHSRRLKSGNFYYAYLIVATPFLRIARYFDDVDGTVDEPIRFYSDESYPLWLDEFATFEDDVRNAVCYRRLVPNVEKALHVNWLAKIHSDPKSLQAKERFQVFDVVAFGGYFRRTGGYFRRTGAQVSQNLASASVQQKDALLIGILPSYTIAMNACLILGISRERFDSHLRIMLQNNVLRCGKHPNNQSFIFASTFLYAARVPSRAHEASRQNKNKSRLSAAKKRKTMADVVGVNKDDDDERKEEEEEEEIDDEQEKEIYDNEQEDEEEEEIYDDEQEEEEEIDDEQGEEEIDEKKEEEEIDEKKEEEEEEENNNEKQDSETEENCCVGICRVKCVNGTNGEERAVSSDWRKFFAVSLSARGIESRHKQCRLCEAEEYLIRKRRFWRRTFVDIAQALQKHHGCEALPMEEIRFILIQMLDEQRCCTLCGGAFEQMFCVENINKPHARCPWKVSFTALKPRTNKVFAGKDEISRLGALVHVACNFAQNDEFFDEVVDLCKLLAAKIDQERMFSHRLNGYHYDIPFCLTLPKEAVDVMVLTGSAHSISSNNTRKIIGNTIRTFEYYTGLQLGYGFQFDFDLNDYGNWPRLMRLSLDRIDVSIPHGENHEKNYRVTFLILNFVKSTFPSDVVFTWLQNIIKKYKV